MLSLPIKESAFRSKIDADNVTLRGGELVLDERILTKTEQESSSDGGNGVLGLGKWNWSENKEEKQQTSIGTTITAKIMPLLNQLKMILNCRLPQ